MTQSILMEKTDAKIETSKNLLSEGIDEEVISRCTGLSLEVIEKLKRKI